MLSLNWLLRVAEHDAALAKARPRPLAPPVQETAGRVVEVRLALQAHPETGERRFVRVD